MLSNVLVDRAIIFILIFIFFPYFLFIYLSFKNEDLWSKWRQEAGLTKKDSSVVGVEH